MKTAMGLLGLTICGISAAAALDYVTHVMPVFEAKCFKCHSEEEGETKGSLAFDNLRDMEEFYIGPFTTMRPGDPENSLLLEFVSDPSSPDAMPPDGKGERLTPEEVETVRQWLAAGAAVHPVKGEEMAAGPVFHEWINAEGNQIEARFLGLQDDEVRMEMRNGKRYAVPLDKLSGESAALARKLAGEAL